MIEREREAIERIQNDLKLHHDDLSGQYRKALRLAIEALKKLEQDRWISVTKRLPEIHKDVLVTDRKVSDVYVSYYCGGGYWNTDTGGANNRIIAWRPLPEPYTEEEE